MFSLYYYLRNEGFFLSDQKTSAKSFYYFYCEIEENLFELCLILCNCKKMLGVYLKNCNFSLEWNKIEKLPIDNNKHRNK